MTARGTCFPLPVSLKKVVNESSSLTLLAWTLKVPSAWMPCSRQKSSQQALPIWTPAWPTWTDMHSRCEESAESRSESPRPSSCPYAISCTSEDLSLPVIQLAWYPSLQPCHIKPSGVWGVRCLGTTASGLRLGSEACSKGCFPGLILCAKKRKKRTAILIKQGANSKPWNSCTDEGGQRMNQW